jgi:two-component system, cell cycle sensor histidine kinase and response regulator CckA
MTTSAPTLHVLLVEDSEEDAALVLLALRKGGWTLQTNRVDSATDLQAALENKTWDLILSDYSMPGFSGLTALKMIKESGLDIPVILISGTIGEDVAVAAIKAGANDYLMKNNLNRLVPAVARELRDYQYRRSSQEELRAAELKLLQSQKMEIVGRLSGGIAHDFNNLLAIILGNVDLLQERLKSLKPDPPEIKSIEKAALHASSLIRQLLAFSRKQALQPAIFELSPALQEIMTMVQMMVGDSVIIKLEPFPNNLSLYMDKIQLEQVMLNLASNARDAMRRSGTLTLTTKIQDFLLQDIHESENAKPGSYVVISVSDTGSGMTPTVMASIFEPFFTTKDSHLGTGLGLSTTLNIVENSGGWIRVESVLGEGTTFHVHLPRFQSTPPKATPSQYSVWV